MADLTPTLEAQRTAPNTAGRLLNRTEFLAPPARSTILVIDDEEAILAALRRLLRREFEVLTARSVAEALDLLYTHDVHVIISDQRMPDMMGTEVLARARSDYPDAIRILLTGYADIDSVIAGINNGQIFRYLIKPWNPDELLATIREAAERCQLVVRNRNLHAALVAAHAELEQRVEERTAEMAARTGALEARTAELAAANARLLELQAMLREQAIRDPLTGLYNRRYLDETLPREVARARRAGAPIGVLLADLDHFKRINDTYGHAAGDAALQAVAVVLRSCIRAEDIACRYGGEEFLLVLPGAELPMLLVRATLIRERIRDLVIPLPAGTIHNLTLSVGVAALPANGDSMPQVLAAVDAALYRAKRQGRDRVELAEARAPAPSMEQEAAP